MTYLSRYVFQTAISNARILGMDQSHVAFRWKDRVANAWRTSGCRALSCSDVFLQHVLPRGLSQGLDTTGSGTPRSESSSIVPGFS